MLSFFVWQYVGTEILMQLTTSAKERKISFVVRIEWVNSQAEDADPFKKEQICKCWCSYNF